MVAQGLDLVSMKEAATATGCPLQCSFQVIFLYTAYIYVARSKHRIVQNLEMELWRENKKGSGKKPAPGNQELTSNR